jgi:hypothetical protein
MSCAIIFGASLLSSLPQGLASERAKTWRLHAPKAWRATAWGQVSDSPAFVEFTSLLVVLL